MLPVFKHCLRVKQRFLCELIISPKFEGECAALCEIELPRNSSVYTGHGIVLPY